MNGNLRFTYAGDDNVILCDNRNLFDPKFRYDKIHLTDHGTALFATNLKYKIAEALDIEVKKVLRNNNQRNRYTRYQQDNRYDHRY